MDIRKEYSLKAHNTFGIDAQADWFIPYESIEELQLLARDEYFQECRHLLLGEGSNMLFLTNFHGIVLHSQITTLETYEEDEAHLTLLVGSGVHWDDLVAYTCARGLGGLECLSLIPGQVGAAAVQNIGAYGAEISQRVVSVHTVHRRTGELRHFAPEECDYAYRHSFFKTAEGADYIVTHVLLRLDKQPELQLDYADLKARVAARSTAPSPEDVRQEVIAIRRSKLPDPAELGNAGSFFMNPIVPPSRLTELQETYPDIPHYPAPEGQIKLSAGWLIDRCGLKGFVLGHVGVYPRQALVLTNVDGEATGQDIARLAQHVQQQVQQHFGIELQPEVRYIS